MDDKLDFLLEFHLLIIMKPCGTPIDATIRPGFDPSAADASNHGSAGTSPEFASKTKPRLLGASSRMTGCCSESCCSEAQRIDIVFETD
jgi:hypothetical protein